MILYHPIEGDILAKRIEMRPRTCFLMTKIGQPIPDQISRIRKGLTSCLRKERMDIIDANSVRTGRDFLVKIWEMIVSVPLGIAIITEDLTPQTMANIFFEIGMFQCLGKAALVVKSKGCTIPSDFVRTEYIEYGRGFKREVEKYLRTFFEQARYYDSVVDPSQESRNPIATIDWLRRSYLITGDEATKKRLDAEIARFLSFLSCSPGAKGEIRRLLTTWLGFPA